ncbi:triphosphoribosyl-dephospho-CoA synthase [Carboxylicivirga sediminis]|uniref:Triphosphoribosyl-dephospho-CoA synthase n=1 Tax=Carboxylicivirga sediminis TaxID=2006564 RepID=A0A941IWR7_9BACT|nr:triphosphoribosyl-dephospho-CoA synthase [Carboxylicivirga sediminis]MBR8534629.1 triphosphoribosyl-dephospho-CoA synthase [Carboxylicivirga sediminis]
MEIIKETEIFESLLLAREARQQYKLDLLQKQYHLVSLQLNIPGLPKTNDILTAFIKEVEADFERYIVSLNANNRWSNKQVLTDAAGDAVIYLFDKQQLSAMELKAITETFEQSFVLGRIVDLDVLDADGQPVSSGKAKVCFICEHAAEDCRKTKRHAIVDVRRSMEEAIDNYLRELRMKEVVTKVASIALQGLLYEVSLSPKPGLVCRQSSGAHTDMDFTTFLNSSAVISPYFIEVCQLAIDFKGKDVSVILPRIKQIGLKMEDAMFNATNGINTHKGAIFLLALSCFAIVRVVNRYGYFKINAFSSVIQQLTRGLVQRELCSAREDDVLTHGQQSFMKYGLQAAGARGEAEQGMPTVLHHSLPCLNNSIDKKLKECTDTEVHDLLIPVLLKLISLNNDTNVIYRHNAVMLEELKAKAKQALNDWDNNRRETYTDLVDWCNDMKISPGGSADLLAVTVTLHLCQTEFRK